MNAWQHLFKASVGSISTTVGYLNYETSLMKSMEFKIGSSVTLVLILAFCIMMYLAYRSVGFLRNKWHVYVQSKTIERKSSENFRMNMHFISKIMSLEYFLSENVGNTSIGCDITNVFLWKGLFEWKTSCKSLVSYIDKQVSMLDNSSHTIFINQLSF